MLEQKEIKELLSLKGRVRGATFITDMKYIELKKGKDELVAFKKEAAKVFKDFDYDKVTNTSWYPVGYRILSLLLIKDYFKFSEKDIFNMGYKAPKISFIVRTLMRYFISLKKTFKEASKYWDEHWSVGSLEPHFINIKNKRLILRIKDFKAHPIMCLYWRGYFSAVAELTLRNQKVTTVENNCMSKGDKYHEFLLTW